MDYIYDTMKNNSIEKLKDDLNNNMIKYIHKYSKIFILDKLINFSLEFQKKYFFTSVNNEINYELSSLNYIIKKSNLTFKKFKSFIESIISTQNIEKYVHENEFFILNNIDL